ncbi:MAG: TAXI family TRAP transporter solute-binding subunit [Desulfobacterales bacterium]
MNRSNDKGLGKRSFRGTIVAGAALCVVLLFPAPSWALDLLIGTNAAGSFSHFAGRTLCRMLEGQLENINCRPVPAPDAVDNLTNLRIGSLDLALVDSRMLHDAARLSGNFRFLDFRYDSLRTLSELYAVPVALVVRSDARIGSLADLKGKRINAGVPRSPEHLAFDMILAAKGWSFEDFSLVEELSSSQSLDTMAFCHGTIQAMLHIGVHPNDVFRQLLRLCNARMASMADADIGKLVADHPAYFPVSVAAGTYPSQPAAVATFGTRVVLVTSEDLDPGTAYRIVESIHRNRKWLSNIHPAFSPFPDGGPPDDAIGIPPHPAVLQYFAESGS